MAEKFKLVLEGIENIVGEPGGEYAGYLTFCLLPQYFQALFLEGCLKSGFCGTCISYLKHIS